MSGSSGSAGVPNERIDQGAETAPDVVVDLEVSLRAAVGRDELRLAYQPEYDLGSGRLLAVEALVRWQHPTRGELRPAEFIALAEQSDLIETIGSWVIDRSIGAFASWLHAGLADEVTLRVNVSPLQLGHADIAGIISGALRKHHVPGSQVCVELTENAPLSDLDAVAESLRRLKELGVTSAIDDLATGYSTLSSLRVLPVDVIKIDRSLVSGIDADTRAQAIVDALVGLAARLAIVVVGEGVESEAEAATLRALGCTRAQGHYLGRPMSAEAIGDLLLKRPENGWKKDADHGL